MRTLSAKDPGFDPTAYHDGQVWTIATAWAAEAAFAVGDVATAMGYLEVIAERILAENGLANECYRGDAAQPFDSCFLLGFSIAPFLTVLFERLWGLERRDLRHELSVAPAFPSGWRTARLRRLRVGPGRVDLDWTPDELGVAWSGPGPLRVGCRGRWLELGAPGAGRLALPPP